MLSRMNWPRFTGEVRVGLEVTSKIDPCVSTPPRGLSLGSVTLRISLPLDALDAVELGQLGVQEGVIAVDQLEHAAVLAGDVAEEHLGLARMARRRSVSRMTRCRGPPSCRSMARTLIVNPSTSRTWSHWPTKFCVSDLPRDPAASA